MQSAAHVMIPRDNLFHAQLLIEAIIRSLEQGFDDAQFDDPGSVRTLNVGRLAQEVDSVVALLVDTLPQEVNRELADHCKSVLQIEYDDGCIFDPETRVPIGQEPTITLPKSLLFDVFASVVAYDRYDPNVDLNTLFPNKDMHHMIKAQLNGTRYLCECSKKVAAFIRSRSATQKEFHTYKAEHEDEIEVDIWDMP